MTRLLFLLGVTATTGKLLVRDKRIPRPIRWGLAATVAMIWLPGPQEEVLLMLIVGSIAIFWRTPMREAWSTAKAEREAKRAAR